MRDVGKCALQNQAPWELTVCELKSLNPWEHVWCCSAPAGEIPRTLFLVSEVKCTGGSPLSWGWVDFSLWANSYRLLCMKQELTAYCWQSIRLDKSPYRITSSESCSRGSDAVFGQHGCYQIWTLPLRYNVQSGRTNKKYSSEIPFIWLLTWEIAQQLKNTTLIMQCQVGRKF